MLKTILLGAAMAVALPANARADEWIVDARYSDPSQLKRLGEHFQHAIIDREKRVVTVEADAAGIAFLAGAGLDVQVDVVSSALLRELQPPGASIESIPSFACYRTVEETAQRVDDLVLAHPQLAAADDVGPTWERVQDSTRGYRMRALRVTNLATAAADPDRPRMVVFSSIHAREYAPAELMTRLAEWLVNGYGSDAQATWLIDHVDFRFVLHANPDGRKKAEAGVLWRKNTDTANNVCPGTPSSSYHAGIDLNRNFPFHWNSAPGGSSGAPCDAVYRGPSAMSEPETQNLVRYVAGIQGGDGSFSGGALPDRKADGTTIAAPNDYAGLFFDIHSYAGLVLYPWGDVEAASPNGPAFQVLGRRLAWFNTYDPMPAVDLYPTDGGTIDTFYGQLGAPSFVMEIGTSFFQPCSSFESTVLPTNLAALKYAARTAQSPYRLPLGPEAYGLAVVPSQVVAGTPARVSATINDLRYRTTSPAQTTYVITAARATVDLPPWHVDALAIPLAAVDGNFDAKTESVSGFVDTSGLAPGRHLVYVQGSNAAGSGTPGVPDAVFLDILDPDDVLFRDGFDTTP
ncbi:MAG: hypothetical protein J0L88_09510 [Xanthomonadales bacterium]|nr:hypothetical protein [Xanthomonadales bacterium]